MGLLSVIFPEGTRAAPGEDKDFNIGGALLAQKSEYPVIPLAHNAGEYWPRYSFFKYPGVIKVKIGPAIETKGKKQNKSTWKLQHGFLKPCMKYHFLNTHYYHEQITTNFSLVPYY